MKWQRWLAQILGTAAVGAIASNLAIATLSLANDIASADTEALCHHWQLVHYDQQIGSKSVDSVETAEDISIYQQWLSASVMPLLDLENPDRPVRREEFLFILEAIAARYGQLVSEERALLKNYCEIHYNAANYLEGRVANLFSKSAQLTSDAHRITNHSEQRSPLRPLWQRKQSVQQHRGSQTQLKQSDTQRSSPQLNEQIASVTVALQTQRQIEASKDASSEVLSASDSWRWPTDVSRMSDLAHAVEIFYFLFGDVSFEDGTFRPTQAVTHASLIDYFSRQNATFLEDLDTVDIDRLRQKYDSLNRADEQLSDVLSDLAEVRSLIEDLEEAIASSPKKSRRNKSRSTFESLLLKTLETQQSTINLQSADVEEIAYDFANQQTANSLTSQNSSILSIISISEVPDVSAFDPVYAPLQVLVEDLGIDMVQADGNFNGEIPLTRGELAQYLEPIFGIVEGFPSGESQTCERASDDYTYLQTEVQRLRLEVQQAFTQLN